MSQVIDIRTRLKVQNNKENLNSTDQATVTDISQARDEMINSDRREVRRTILTEFISVHSVVPGYGVLKVHLYDINDKGLSFDVEEQRGSYNVGDVVELRIYLNHQTYFKIETKVAHLRSLPEEGVVRHGCGFINDSLNNEALSYFVRFIESVTASLKKDNGDILVSKVNS